MSPFQGHQATAALEPVKIRDDCMILQAPMTLERPMPDQDTALLMTAALSWHFATAMRAELAYQVGAWLVVGEVHCSTRSLLVLANEARWIRDWFVGLGFKEGQDRPLASLAEAPRAVPESGLLRPRLPPPVRSLILEAWWHGRVGEAIEALYARGWRR
jgi:hypothetical protein